MIPQVERFQPSGSAGPSGLASSPSVGRYNVARDRQRREVRPPIRYGYFDLVSYALLSAEETAGDEPLSYEEAMRLKDSKLWLEAMKSEMESLNKNKTWILVDRPLNKRVVGCKWLFNIKPR